MRHAAAERGKEGGVLFDLSFLLLVVDSALHTLRTHTTTTTREARVAAGAVSFSDRAQRMVDGRRTSQTKSGPHRASVLTITLMGDTATAAFDSLTE